jgi:hypothetical protein
MQHQLDMCHLIHLIQKQLWHPEMVPTKHPLCIICQSDTRAQKACEKFYTLGHTQIVNVVGGTQAWQEKGLPVVRGKKVLSLERKVRITAGIFVLTGALLGWIIHPSFIGISAFVGAGLVFAGITDSCGMGMMLAKMPWNQISQECKNGQRSD